MKDIDKELVEKIMEAIWRNKAYTSDHIIAQEYVSICKSYAEDKVKELQKQLSEVIEVNKNLGEQLREARYR